MYLPCNQSDDLSSMIDNIFDLLFVLSPSFSKMADIVLLIDETESIIVHIQNKILFFKTGIHLE